MNTRLVENLRAMRELLSVPERWTQRAAARQVNGKSCFAESPGAVCWCLDGARQKIVGIPPTADNNEVAVALNAEVPANRNYALPLRISFNDAPTTRHANVLALLDRAIATAEAS